MSYRPETYRAIHNKCTSNWTETTKDVEGAYIAGPIVTVIAVIWICSARPAPKAIRHGCPSMAVGTLCADLLSFALEYCAP